ncbi:hypothetical protein PAHAL_2G389800 [Panicum hallii]|uniref:Uncharacterized protein n=2 Tax=Panicum hallii TaxID=206008 RepID=A0A2S3H1A7_9POAL|nr:hypothetical protein PAHAL_2G389800 [Panicum hallii]
MALGRYVPFIIATVGEERWRQCKIEIVMNVGSSWHGITHHHPAKFDTLAMDPELKRTLIADLDRFLKRKDYYRRIGKAWTRGYLLYGPPGTGKSSLVAAMANYLHFNLYDLDLSDVHSNSTLQKLLIGLENKSILVIEDIDCCFSAASREEKSDDAESDSSDSGKGRSGSDGRRHSVRAAQLHRRAVVDEQRAAHHRLHHQLQGPPRRGAAPTGAHGHAGTHGLMRLGGVQDAGPELLPRRRPRPVPGGPGAALGGGAVEVTPAEVSEMLLRSEDADVALQGLVEFLQDKKQQGEASRDGK